jgi:hypothetical protein
MKLRQFIQLLALCSLLALSTAAQRKPRTNDPKADAPATARKPDQKQSGAAVAARLRADWDLGQLRMMRLVIDEGSFDANLKQSLGEAIDGFAQKQEDLLAEVAASPDKEASIQSQRAKLQAAFAQKMKVVNDSDAMRKEMTTRLKAMDKEIDVIAKSADGIFAHLDAVGVTKQQKDKLRPAVKDASDKVRGTVDKSETRSTKDKKSREQVVAHWQVVHRKLRDNLTPEQREKLVKKLADE